MFTTHRSTLSIINNLIEACKNDENGYKAAAEKARDADLKYLFLEFAERRSQFISELQAHVKRLGGVPRLRGNTLGTTPTSWIDLRNTAPGKNEPELIKECAHGEEATHKVFEEALDDGLAGEIRVLVDDEYAVIKRTSDRLRILEEMFKHSAA